MVNLNLCFLILQETWSWLFPLRNNSLRLAVLFLNNINSPVFRHGSPFRLARKALPQPPAYLLFDNRESQGARALPKPSHASDTVQGKPCTLLRQAHNPAAQTH